MIISGAAYLGIMTQTRLLAALRAALTIAFVYFGLRKLTGHSTDVAIYEAIGFGQFPRYVTGSVEVFGAALLWWRGWEGIAGLLLLATMITGLSALLIWVGPPYLHMLALMAGTGTVAYAYRADTLHKIAQLRDS